MPAIVHFQRSLGKLWTNSDLCDLTARTIKHGLTHLLGIEVVEQM